MTLTADGTLLASSRARSRRTPEKGRWSLAPGALQYFALNPPAAVPTAGASDVVLPVPAQAGAGVTSECRARLRPPSGQRRTRPTPRAGVGEPVDVPSETAHSIPAEPHAEAGGPGETPSGEGTSSANPDAGGSVETPADPPVEPGASGHPGDPPAYGNGASGNNNGGPPANSNAGGNSANPSAPENSNAGGNSNGNGGANSNAGGNGNGNGRQQPGRA